MTAPIDYNAVLADLEGKIAQMTAAAAVIRSLIGAGATEIPTGSASVASGEEGPPVVTAFFQTRNKEWGLKEWHGNKSKGDAE